jgi:hypothetical protein
MSETAFWHANLSPVSRVAAAKALPLSRFVASQEARGLLLVSLKNETPKFVAMLSRVEGESPNGMTSQGLDLLTRIAEPERRTWPAELAQSFDEDALVGLVENTRHFVVAIRKRPGCEMREPGRTTVGRANDTDIVLSSPTVSKLHAWFELDEQGNHWLTDTGSRNGTRINGQRIAPHRPAALEPGDRIDFGLVRTVFCPITTFWRALQHN